jgi:hypothetical protein
MKANVGCRRDLWKEGTQQRTGDGQRSAYT